MEITKRQFKAYEMVRASGVTNMWNVDLASRYPDVRNGKND